jgi:hypothetical protein
MILKLSTKRERVVDALSRKEEVEALLCTISILQANWVEEARIEL